MLPGPGLTLFLVALQQPESWVFDFLLMGKNATFYIVSLYTVIFQECNANIKQGLNCSQTCKHKV